MGVAVGMQIPGGDGVDEHRDLPHLDAVLAMDASWQGLPSIQSDMDCIFDNCRSMTLRGKGSAGTDNIYVSLLTSNSSSSDYRNLSIYGHTNYDATLRTISQQGVSAGYGCLLWDLRRSRTGLSPTVVGLSWLPKCPRYIALCMAGSYLMPRRLNTRIRCLLAAVVRMLRQSLILTVTTAVTMLFGIQDGGRQPHSAILTVTG